MRKAVAWFAEQQTPEGNWSDVEDTASALLGLLRLLNGILRRRSESAFVPGRSPADDLAELLRREVDIPRLSLVRRFVERDPENGYYSFHVRESTARTLLFILGLLFVGLIGWLADIMGLVTALRDWLRK